MGKSGRGRKKRDGSATLQRHDWPIEGWRTSADWPPRSLLAERDPFFGRVERLVRVSSVAEHGISRLSEKVVPLVVYAESSLPPWTPESRAFNGAQIMLAEGPESMDLWRLWCIDVLDEAGVLKAKDLFTTGRATLDRSRLQTLQPFTREGFAAEVLILLERTRKGLSSDSSEVTRAEATRDAFQAGMLVREYELKVTHETEALQGKKIAAARPTATQESSRVRGATSEENHKRWIAKAQEILKTDRKASLRDLGAYIAADPKVSGHRKAGTIRKALAVSLGKMRR